MLAVVVVVIHKGADLPFLVARYEVVFEQHAVLHSLVSALDLALCLRLMRRTANVVQALAHEILSQIGRNVG